MHDMNPSPSRFNFMFLLLHHLCGDLCSYVHSWGSSLVHSLVSEPEIQSLIPLVFRGCEVFLLLWLAHCIPDSVPLPVDGHIEHFDEYKQADVVREDRKQDFVAGVVLQRRQYGSFAGKSC